MAQTEREREQRRFVRSEDPSLTPEANRLLTEELREVIGADTVAVPAGAPARHHQQHGTRGPFLSNLVANRQILLIALATAIVFGVFLSLVTGSWWALVAAVTVHALGTAAVAGGVIRLATLTEHVSPEVAARLEAEGVPDPDRVLTELVGDFSDTTGPARAAAEHQGAMTPSSEPTAAAGDTAADVLPLAVTAFLAAFTIAVAAWFGGTMWVLPGVVLPLCGLWIVLMSRLAAREEAAAHGGGDARARTARRLLPTAASIVLGVAIFMIGMGFLVHAL